MDFNTEQDARILIDDLLKSAGWDITNKNLVNTEFSIYLDNNSVKEPSIEYNTSINSNQKALGRADYLLRTQDGKPLAIIEAKKSALQPYRAKQQALPYAKAIGAPFIFLTNGDLIYFWDYLNDDARIVSSFYSQRDLERLLQMRIEKHPMATIKIPDTYIRQGEKRLVRGYQQEAMKALDHSLELGKRRFLIELPTGTGKTDLITLDLKRLIDANRAEKILFLVDREQLAKQALEAFQDILPQHGSYWLKPGMIRQEKQITVCLLQTMVSRYTEFTSGYYDVVVADECHRSIYGAWQTALTHFDALHIGLTATPSIYIERNTFQFYQCKEDKPDFSYKIQDAFVEGHLVPYKFADRITELISDGADLNEDHYDPSEFERKWTNSKTNQMMMEEFDKLAWEKFNELAPNQKIGPGKAIVFAITKNHATRLTEYLNQLHPELKGKYAEVITSDVANADELIRKFKRETYPMIAVSVGMLDTGFDCREVLHLVMCRRVRSPILYQQMRGRGTRTCDSIDKKKFMIYDFFGNHKYFNDSEFDIFSGAGGGRAYETKPDKPKTHRELIELGLDDEWLYNVNYVEYGPQGERIDKRDYLTNWEETIKKSLITNPIIEKIKKQSEVSSEEKDNYSLTEEEEKRLAEILNSPDMYFNEDNLRNAYRNPGGNIIDFIKYALGVEKQKSKEEIITENFHAWLVTKSLTTDQAQYLNMLKNRGVVKGKIEIDDLFQPPLSILNAAGLGIELFGENGLKNVISEMNESIFNAKVG
ncbi:MAG: type III restriction enzyme res subunit [Ignavibacteria bacterium]|nr:MAG: type III restriction enzyme res subunit [Ignavibacteria bacterium]KAF0158922.1 MAG: type III restriction enzyme res subunit [Ignavibacteria bacterium]